MAVAMETAAKDATEFQSIQHEATVHKFSKGRISASRLKQKPKKPCYRCNRTNQLPDKCRDFKVTLNPALQVDQYPLPKIENIFANLAGGEKFTKLDLRQAYLQLHLSEDSKPLLTINTHKGLYRYHRMTYGISPAPSIWPRAIDTILQGLPGVQCILDDMIITR